MRTVYLGPIYPVALKPASTIRTWADWPDDVRDTLRHWNSGHLSFVYSGIFKCMRCEEFCRPQPHGTCKLDGDWYCDDCMIALARKGHVPQGPKTSALPVPRQPWRGGGVMRRRAGA